MLREFRYQARAANGKPIQGTVLAKNKGRAKKLVDKLAARHKLNVIAIDPKKDFLYYLKLPNGKTLKGRQSAYSKEEVLRGLKTLGYNVKKVEPVLFDIKTKPPYSAIMMFVSLSSFLLKEQMSYDKILRMLAEEERNPVLKDTLKKIESELKKGKEGTDVFNRYGHVFGKFPAYMLGLATKSGNMAEVYDATAKFMERELDFKKAVKSALIQPLFVVIAMLLAVLYYVVSIFPQTAHLFLRYDMQVPPMTAFTLQFSDYLADNWGWIVLIMIVPVIICLVWWKTPKGRIWRDKMIINLPMMGDVMHKLSIEIFFRVFGAIYGGAESNIETIQASAEACRNKYMETNIKEITIPLMLKEGMSLVPALEQADVFNRNTLSQLRSGAETGNVLSAARTITVFYEKETTYKMKNITESIAVFIGAFIGIVITLLTIVSAEIAMVSPPTPGMGGM